MIRLLPLTSSVLLAQIGEAPHISQPHREAHLGQDVLQLAVPCGASFVLRQLYVWHVLPSCRADIQGAVFVVERFLVCEQISHRLCDMLQALLALRHLAVLTHE